MTQTNNGTSTSRMLTYKEVMEQSDVEMVNGQEMDLETSPIYVLKEVKSSNPLLFEFLAWNSNNEHSC